MVESFIGCLGEWVLLAVSAPRRAGLFTIGRERGKIVAFENLSEFERSASLAYPPWLVSLLLVPLVLLLASAFEVLIMQSAAYGTASS